MPPSRLSAFPRDDWDFEDFPSLDTANYRSLGGEALG